MVGSLCSTVYYWVDDGYRAKDWVTLLNGRGLFTKLDSRWIKIILGEWWWRTAFLTFWHVTEGGKYLSDDVDYEKVEFQRKFDVEALVIHVKMCFCSLMTLAFCLVLSQYRADRPRSVEWRQLLCSNL